jgi:hypothetical protein
MRGITSFLALIVVATIAGVSTPSPPPDGKE